MIKDLNIQRCRNAMKRIYVRGVCNNKKREDLIERAIAEIQENPRGCFSKEYMGIKNYAGFGDQEVDCRYGMGPRHGSIVFSVGRMHRQNLPPLGDDEIYLLEAVRDFGGVAIRNKNGMKDEVIGLTSLLIRISQVEDEVGLCYSALLGATVKKDGESWCAHGSDFVNLAESHAEFADSPTLAVEYYLSSVQVGS